TGTVGSQPEIFQTEREAVLEPGVGHLLGGPGTAVDDHRDGDDLSAGLPDGLDGGESRAAGGGGVLDHQHAAARDVGALDPALQPVLLGVLAHDERVEAAPGGSARVQHGGGDGVRTERESADGVEVEVGDQFVHDAADDGRGGAVEGDAAHVHVVV